MKHTSRKSNGSSKVKSVRLPIEGPFAAGILAKARTVAGRYRVILRQDEKGGYLGTSLEIPTVFATRKSAGECVDAAYQALAVAVATMLEAGVTPPEPFVERKRTEQMNVRLDAEEKLRIREAAARSGYRSASDYVRAVALKEACGSGFSGPA